MQCASSGHEAREGKYSCPRCGRAYCDLACFREFHGHCEQGARDDVNRDVIKGFKADDTARFGRDLVKIHDKLEDDSFDNPPVFSEARLAQLAELVYSRGMPDFEDFTEEELRHFDPNKVIDEAWQPWWQSAADSDDEDQEEPEHLCCSGSTGAREILTVPEHISNHWYDIKYAATVHALLIRFYQGDFECFSSQFCPCEILQDSCAVFDIPRKFNYQRDTEWQKEWLGVCGPDPRSSRKAYRILPVWPLDAYCFQTALKDLGSISRSKNYLLRVIRKHMRLLRVRKSKCANCKELWRRCRLWLSVVNYHDLNDDSKFFRTEPTF